MSLSSVKSDGLLGAKSSIGIGGGLELVDGLRAAGNFEWRREHFVAELRL
jgi:hypothetical protein